jgi:ABC-type sugar transport system permease subunit
MNVGKVTKKKVNLLYALLAIVHVWIAVLAIGVFWAWVFGGEQFLIRNILLSPSVIVGLYVSEWIWQHHQRIAALFSGLFQPIE